MPPTERIPDVHLTAMFRLAIRLRRNIWSRNAKANRPVVRPRSGTSHCCDKTCDSYALVLRENAALITSKQLCTCLLLVWFSHQLHQVRKYGKSLILNASFLTSIN